MKEYKDFSVDDFITDDRFLRWVRFPEPGLDKFWSDFADQHPECLNKMQEAREFLIMLGPETITLPDEKLELLHQHVSDRLDTPVSASTVHRILTNRSKANRVYAYAAIILATALSLLSWWVLSPSQGDVADPDMAADVVTNQPQEHVIPKGKRSRILLEDGTQVWMNADSKLEYEDDLLEGTREVTLKGEAYFDVKPDASRPFIVHIQGVDIKVLGTSFNVKGYDNDPQVEATLVHGKISIAGRGDADRVTLAANQRAVFLKEKGKLLVENNVETDNYTLWRKGVLVFDDQPLYEILPILERTFNVIIHTEDASALDCRFTAKINNKSLLEVLELFKTSDTISYRLVGNEVFIKGSFCEE